MKTIAMMVGFSILTTLYACHNNGDNDNNGNPAGQSVQDYNTDSDEGGDGQSGVGGGTSQSDQTGNGGMNNGQYNDSMSTSMPNRP